ncbi:TVP38/TMEM64 family protein [Halorhodospira halochloris]|nr:VTT domain-containing protein [Halorhodospira halochloris]
MAERQWLLLVVVVAQAALFTLALPGSLALWVVAPFYPPLLSTITLTLGSTLGAVGAYHFSLHFGRAAITPESRWVRLLSRHGDFLSQCAVRAMPGFPHAPINYAGGLLKLPLFSFALAACIGLGLKSGVYSFAVYEAVEVAEEGRIDRGAIGVVFVLFVLFLSGAALRHWFVNREEAESSEQGK